MANVIERYPGKWYVRFTHKGKQIRRYAADTKSEAMAVLRELKKRIALDSFDLPELPKKKKIDPILFEDFTIKYLDYCHAEKSYKTYKAELDRINAHWIPFLKGKLLTEISPLEIQKWREMRLAKGISNHTLYSDLKVLKSMFTRARQWGLFSSDDPIGKLPRTYKRDVTLWKPEEIELYLQACHPTYYPLAATLIFTGMRIGELFNLRWSDIDFKRNVIRIRPDSSLKNEDGRDIPINSQLQPLLQGLTRTSEWVFPGQDGIKQRTTCQHAHEKACKKAGLKHIRVHDLRHAFASLAIQAGHDISSISKLLGHKSTKITTDIYFHLHPEHAKKVVDDLPIKLTKKGTGTQMVPINPANANNDPVTD